MLGSEELRRGLSIIDRNARAQTQLIDDLLDMGRITSGKVRLTIETIDLREVVDAASSAVAPAAEAKGIRLISPSAAEPAWVRGDASRLQQVLWNLLGNAVKFTPSGGEVRLSLATLDETVEVRVSDTGEGIAPDFLPFVFDRFRQADASTARKFSGLGIGLAIVKNFVDLHGGAVEVTSAGTGMGATFTVRLPKAPPEGDAARHVSDRRAWAPDVRALAGLSVLLVDDEAEAREVIGRLLGECGAEVVTAESGEQGLALLEAGAFDLLVSDVGMPGMDGYAFIGRVRALRGTRGRSIPAIALTAFSREEDRSRALRSGFQAHLAKPIQPGALVTAIAALTNVGQADGRLRT